MCVVEFLENGMSWEDRTQTISVVSQRGTYDDNNNFTGRVGYSRKQKKYYPITETEGKREIPISGKPIMTKLYTFTTFAVHRKNLKSGKIKEDQVEFEITLYETPEGEILGQGHKLIDTERYKKKGWNHKVKPLSFNFTTKPEYYRKPRYFETDQTNTVIKSGSVICSGKDRQGGVKIIWQYTDWGQGLNRERLQNWAEKTGAELTGDQLEELITVSEEWILHLDKLTGEVKSNNPIELVW